MRRCLPLLTLAVACEFEPHPLEVHLDSGEETDSLVVLGDSGDGNAVAEICQGGQDEDGDGKVDCDDPDCWEPCGKPRPVDTGGSSSGNRAPVAVLTTKESIHDLFVGDRVTLTSKGSVDPEGAALAFQWAILARPSGSTAVLSAVRTPEVSFLLDRQGDYFVELVVSDGQRDTSTGLTVLARPPNQRPVANAGSDRAVAVGVLGEVDGSQSYDPEGEKLLYTWSLVGSPAGSFAQPQVAPNPYSAHKAFLRPDKAGTYALQLVVSDGVRESEPDLVKILASP
ncbi:MAG: hypothetical protein H6732_11995 [Alphaproteobacteria bacterium]|nr:hypothetical protein [Alphaproteobacteria bacterium]